MNYGCVEGRLLSESGHMEIVLPPLSGAEIQTCVIYGDYYVFIIIISLVCVSCIIFQKLIAGPLDSS